MLEDELVQIVIPRGEARAFTLGPGQVMRLGQRAPGGQVADLAVFNRENPHERLWGAKTAWEYGVHLSVGASLLSTGPWERALLTIVGDSLSPEPTARGAQFHDVLSGCCSSKSHVRRYGLPPDLPGCFDVLAEALAPHGVPADFVQDTFDPFMRTGVVNNRLFHEPSDASADDFIELRAEMNVIVAISACQGRSSRPESQGLRVQISGA